MAKCSRIESGIEKKLRELIVRCDEALRVGRDQQTNDDAGAESRQANSAMHLSAYGVLGHRRMPACCALRRESHKSDPAEN
jgi:hypothetical protein